MLINTFGHHTRPLVVVAHPDDEVLGCGGLAAWFADDNVSMQACILSGRVDARQGRPSVQQLEQDAREAAEILGMPPPVLGNFPNIAMNSIPHIEVVKFIEDVIIDVQATDIWTHHPSDLNDDHRQVSAACQAASRIYQRQGVATRLQSLHYMEVLSSTEWAYAGPQPYQPTTFLPLTDQQFKRKIDALAAYRGVMRESPHPRSLETVHALATLRGSQSAAVLAESFATVYQDYSYAGE